MPIQQDWKIKSRSHQCALTEKPFEDKEEIYTAIFLAETEEDGDFQRRDFCIDAWDGHHEELKPFSYWRTAYQAPPPPEEEVLQKQSAEAQLRQMIEEDSAETENSRYILALLLERKKTIKETDRQQVSDGLIRIYEHVGSGEVFIVKDPQLPLNEVTRLEGEVERLFPSTSGSSPEGKPESQQVG
ncbi:MAG: hypothetical protein AAGA58_06440 [Verrucomicrobiota bacterium]